MHPYKNILKKIVLVSIFFSVFLAPLSVSINDLTTNSESREYSSALILESNIAEAQVGNTGGPGGGAGGAIAGAVGGVLGDAAALLGKFLATVILNTASLFTWVGGQLLEIAISQLVLGFGSWINDVNFGGMIDNVWTIVRDVANLLFIFGFIFIGIKLILNGSDSDAKSMLAQLIIAAILINFSLFITKAIIEVSNFVAYSIYGAMTQGDGTIPQTVIDILGLTTFWKPLSAETTAGLTSGGATGFFIMGAIFLIIAGFTFLNGAMMLISRFVGLIFIMMFSPVLFAAQIFPQTAGHAQNMWKKLFSYSFYAPAYIFLIFVSLLVLDKIPLSKDVGFSAVFGAPEKNGGDFFSIVLNFVIAIFVIQVATTLASRMGLAGSEMVLKITEGSKKWMANKAGGLALDKASRALRNFEFAKTAPVDQDGNAVLGRDNKPITNKDVNKGIMARMGGSALGQFALKVDPLLSLIQKGGMRYKNSVIKRGEELKGYRNGQLQRRTETFLSNPKYFGGKLTWLRDREIMATALAYHNKGDLDEVAPRTLKFMMDTFKKTGQGFTKIARLRFDAGDPHRYDRDGKNLLFKNMKLEKMMRKNEETGEDEPVEDVEGNQLYHWILDDDAPYMKIGKEIAEGMKDDDGNFNYQKLAALKNTDGTNVATEIDQYEYLMGESDISDLERRIKKSPEISALHNRNGMNTNDPHSPGGHDYYDGYRDLQVMETGDAMVTRMTGDMVATLMRLRNSYTTEYVRGLHEMAGVHDTSKPYIEFFKELEKRALEYGDNDMASRVRSQAEWFDTPVGKRAMGLDGYNVDRSSSGSSSGSGASKPKPPTQPSEPKLALKGTNMEWNKTQEVYEKEVEVYEKEKEAWETSQKKEPPDMNINASEDDDY